MATDASALSMRARTRERQLPEALHTGQIQLAGVSGVGAIQGLILSITIEATAEGITFQLLKDEARRDLAIYLLADRRNSTRGLLPCRICRAQQPSSSFPPMDRCVHKRGLKRFPPSGWPHVQ
ncbi:hypothetical protein GCM10010994_38830 [Chelatococcus reniformis]|uniref:Uncharacterized protein n=1 Tax=Chelatococcus reniformis TaxID=1494448 RepID=A0A916ULG0_9HYPH|nr:hypothetical protein GCM10010994_38830 [Chelatococcus reniformis]